MTLELEQISAPGQERNRNYVCFSLIETIAADIQKIDVSANSTVSANFVE
jgi:hypothetical protein